MSFARYIPLAVLLSVGLLAVTSVTVPVDESSLRFEAKEYAALQSKYRELQQAPGSARAEFLHSVTQACAVASLTPAMNEKMQKFSQTILESREESAEVKSAAKKLSAILLARKTSAGESRRTPAAENRQ